MPNKLKFHVVYCSSEDEHHPITEWYVHNPNSRGWQTPKGISTWPQEIGLQFEETANIQKIQFLSHQCKIASIIELFVGNPPDRNFQSYSQAEFKRLGYMSLDENSKTDFKARELKSVHVRATGLYLKLLIHKPHPNHLNTYQQVGIIAVNIQGEPAPQKSPAFQSGSESGYPVDSVTAQKIFSLNLAKENAARVENYELAMQLKDVINYLRKIVPAQVGQEIGKIDQKKKMAVEVEDYEAAAALKKEVEQLRAMAYSNIPEYPEVSGSRTPSPSELMSPRVAEQVVNPGYFQDFRAQGPPAHKEYMQDYGLPRATSIPNSRQSQSTYEPRMPSLSPLSLSAYDPRSSTSHFDPPLRMPPPSHSAHSSSSSTSSSSSFPPSYAALSHPPAHDAFGGGEFMRASVHEFPRHGDAGTDAQLGPRQISASADAQPIAPRQISTSADAQVVLPRQTSARDVPKNAYEDRPLPTAKYGFGGETPRNREFDAQPAIDDRPIKAKDNSRKQNEKQAPIEDDEPPPIPKDAVHLISVFGEENVRGLYDTAWAGREQALKAIEMSLPIKDTDPDTAFKSLCNVLARSFADKIPQIYLAALSLLQAVLAEYGNEIRGPVLRHSLSTLLPNIVAKTADNNTRLRDASFVTLLSFAQHPNVGPHLVGSHVAKPAKNQAQWKLILGRIGVLIEMIPVFGLSDSHSHPIEDEPSPGLDSDMVCNFICNAFDSPNSDVRSAAVQAMAEVYRINPQKAQQVTTGVKPKLLELIRIAFKEADEQKGDQPPPVFYEQKKSPRVDSGLPKKAKNSSSSDLSKQPSKSSSSKQLDKKPDSKQPPPPSSSSSSSSSSQPSQKQPNNTQKQPNNPPNQTNTQKQKKEQKSETSSNSNNSNNNNTNNNHRVLSPSPSPSSSPIPPNHTHEDSDAFQVYTNESTRCQFCGLEDENFTEDLLDQHYMRDCPMLCECDCEQVIEISCLNEHQLTECDNAPHRAACPNCKMALPDFDLEAHIAECPESWAQATWQQCPLCYNPTPLLTSKQWFLHLSKECPNNPRNDLAASTY